MRVSLPVSSSKFCGDLAADPAELHRLADGLADHGGFAADRLGTFGDDDDRETCAAAIALQDRLGDRFELVGDLGDQDAVGATGHAGVQRDPPGVAPHHLDHHHPAV